MNKYEFWFVTGSQYLYGEDTLKKVAQDSQKIVDGLNKSADIPCKIICKPTLKTSDEITQLIKDANYDDNCAGIIAWMHTFSPSKMWINGLEMLNKPYCHLHTQFNRCIPDEGIDMDFMNLNQSAHGDREHGFIGARMGISRKIIAGFHEDKTVTEPLGSFMRSAAGYMFGKSLRVVRFGDNMREVAVTEGDKVETQRVFGWQVNTWPVGELASEIEKVTENEAAALADEYKRLYELNTEDLAAIIYQAKEEIAIDRILKRERATAFSNTFEDLWGMEQLPGIATQHLMQGGIGYGAEGDWKTAALTAVIKEMTSGMGGGCSFMEDYTYDLTPGKELALGAHMLEVCPSIAAAKPKIEVHPLGIGNRQPPARLVFEGKQGKATVSSLVDMGGRMRLIVQDIECVKPIYKMPNLPVARVMWKPMPDLLEGARLWILAGGAHHTVLSYDATPQMLSDFAEMCKIEFVHITKDTTFDSLKQQLFLADLAWKLK